MNNSDMLIGKINSLLTAYHEGKLGGEKMPEDENPSLDKGSNENYIYFTLPMALNYQRNSYTLWESANKLYADAETRCIFDTKAVTDMSDGKLRDLLLKYKVALQPNKQPIIWKTICQTIKTEFNGAIRELFQRNNYSVAEIKRYIAENKKKFPTLAVIKSVTTGFMLWSSIRM